MTVEEVATLAARFGWSYETLMSMSGAERRLWLAAADRVGGGGRELGAPAAGSGPGRVSASSTAPASVAPPLATDAERRARLLALHEELNHRGR